MDVAKRVSVQLQLTDPDLKSRWDRVVKKSEKDSLYAAMDVGCIWRGACPRRQAGSHEAYFFPRTGSGSGHAVGHRRLTRWSTSAVPPPA